MSQQNAELIFIRISLRSRFTMHIKHATWWRFDKQKTQDTN